MSNVSEKALVGSVLVLGGLGLAVASILWSGLLAGWAVSLLWGWFVVPVFAAPVLGVWQSIGLVLLVTALTAGIRKTDNTKRTSGELLSKTLLEPLFVYGLLIVVGWFVHLFMSS